MNEPPRSATLELVSGRARAVVEPAGSRVRLLVVDGRDLLVAPGDDPLLWGCYPMAPWAGRLDRGRFGHDGEPIEVPVDLPVLAVSSATTPRETRLVSRLDSISRDATEADMNAPVLFVIGRVVDLHRPDAVRDIMAGARRRARAHA